MTNTPTEKARRIIEYYGAWHQLVKLCEECAELTQQAVKCYEMGRRYSASLVEEMADVKVMLMQFESIMTPDYKKALEQIVVEKLDRQIERIENDN
jgi:NTP pyrophosphatase (non-canonical NTP hydrolase)